jgi:hypothetical protein
VRLPSGEKCVFRAVSGVTSVFELGFGSICCRCGRHRFLSALRDPSFKNCTENRPTQYLNLMAAAQQG